MKLIMINKYSLVMMLISFMLFSRVSDIVHAEDRYYSIQVGAFKELDNAMRRVKQLKELDYNAFYRDKDIKGNGKWYRVYIDRYGSKKEAEKEAKNLINSGLISGYSVKLIDEKSTAGPGTIEPDKKVYYLHVNSFKEKTNAERSVQRLEKRGFKTFFVAEKISVKNWFRVYVGEFDDEKEAEQAGLKLKEEGLISYFKTIVIDKKRLSRGPVSTKAEKPAVPVKREESNLLAAKKSKSTQQPKHPPKKTGAGMGKTENTLVIKDITFKSTKDGTEIVFIYSDRYFTPSVFALEGEKPRLVIDIKNATVLKKGLSKIIVNGKLIKQIRTNLKSKSNTLRVVLDHYPSANYFVSQVYYEAENIFALEVKEEKETEVKEKEPKDGGSLGTALQKKEQGRGGPPR